MSEVCERCGLITDHPEWQEVCNCHLYAEIERLRALFRSLLVIKEAADGQRALISNQGQAMDGYTELASYRSVLKEMEGGGEDE